MINHLNGLVFPEDSGLKKERLNNSIKWLSEFDKKYDYHTFFYDAFWLSKSECICLICPILLNFETTLKNGRFYSEDKEKYNIKKIKKYKRYIEIYLRCPKFVDNIFFTYMGMSWNVKIEKQDTITFSSLNCAVLKSKDNELDWIKDWVKYHVKTHNLEGLIFFDNQSSKYSLIDIENQLETSGLKQYRILSAPYPFGLGEMSRTLCLQAGLLNIARLRYLQNARAVLSVDIDELVSPVENTNIFDLTCKSLCGYIKFYGKWRHAKHTQGIARHKDHIYRMNNDACSTLTKYCISMKGLFRNSHWEIHRAPKIKFDNIFINRRVYYMHCEQISTNWKYNRSISSSKSIRLDKETLNTLSQYI